MSFFLKSEKTDIKNRIRARFTIKNECFEKRNISMLMPSRNHCVQDVVPAVGSEGFGCGGKSYGCQV